LHASLWLAAGRIHVRIATVAISTSSLHGKRSMKLLRIDRFLDTAAAPPIWHGGALIGVEKTCREVGVSNNLP
jgi:hypothetical protein